MSYRVDYTTEADETIAKYKKSNPIAYKKFLRLLKEITEHPREGTGHPKPLVNGNDIKYSRRISGNDRIIYNIYDDTVIVLIVSVGGHYDDK
jgi:toxin YoeB